MSTSESLEPVNKLPYIAKNDFSDLVKVKILRRADYKDKDFNKEKREAGDSETEWYKMEAEVRERWGGEGRGE